MDTVSGTYIQDLEVALGSIVNSNDPNHLEAVQEYRKVISYLRKENDEPEIIIDFGDGDWT